MNVKSFIVALLVFVIWMTLIGFLYNGGANPFQDNVEITTVAKDTLKTSSVEKKEIFDEPLAEEKIIIPKDAFPFPNKPYIKDTIRISRKTSELYFNDTLVYKITDYLSKNLDKRLIVTGIYNTSSNDSLARIRVEKFKKLILDKKIDTTRVKTKILAQNFYYQEDDTYSFGLLLEFKTIPENERIKLNEHQILKKVVRTSFDSTEFTEDDDMRYYITKVKSYLNKNQKKIVFIRGYTDSIGKEDTNKWVSWKRAEAVRKYLISKGVEEEKIKVFSMGETNPIADNGTKKGRYLNRRVEISIKDKNTKLNKN